MFSRRGVKCCETRDHDFQGCSVYGEDEVSQYTRDKVMFPEIVEYVKGAETLEGAHSGVNVGGARHRVISTRSSSKSIKSSGSKKPRGPEQSTQGQRGLNLPFDSETPRVLLKHQIVCHRCGPGHIRSQCQRGQKSCFTCGEFNHVARNCPQGKIMKDELGLVQQPETRLIISQSQPQSVQRQPTVRVSTSPENVGSQGRKRQRELNQLSHNRINLGLSISPKK
ncbi:hypothetical protein RHMOL_Rhmol10G0187000 [Rhododendron molle]|uniref:Uncharacterized protein n=1 Tax=Rhododendron molle TaxID=49168 RepID=A0ACC0M424_RHOML|nr:hypothetical protein RHMOL_Rhmol10G0187000 [Rhododendron molle]